MNINFPLRIQFFLPGVLSLILLTSTCFSLVLKSSATMSGVKGCVGPKKLLEGIVTDIKARLMTSDWFVNIANDYNCSSWLNR